MAGFKKPSGQIAKGEWKGKAAGVQSQPAVAITAPSDKGDNDQLSAAPTIESPGHRTLKTRRDELVRQESLLHHKLAKAIGEKPPELVGKWLKVKEELEAVQATLSDAAADGHLGESLAPADNCSTRCHDSGGSSAGD
ncbi:hypothetical protein NKR19_g8982 [Coniochaeta hoffmannii]|uniref:Uncharacterized protein n=1 Tax=Coniochaeta hoffmannii TaxID=91930 RepID=A0AA38VL95_9PEZI|nr:hypothetical protein NKR19_g8982 [Coniochaeta hoffmannii]